LFKGGRWRSTEAVLQRAVSIVGAGVSASPQVANGRQLSSSFGLRARDRATRLRSSDAQKPIGRFLQTNNNHQGTGILDTKDWDVVTAQLWFF
jgi:hypothetical protein